MSTSLLSSVEQQTRVGWLTRVSDFVELTKPRILSLVLVTIAVAAYISAAGRPDVIALLHALLGTSLVAASGSIFNQTIERRTDARMERTANRPIASGRITVLEAVLFGGLTVTLGIGYLLLTIGSQTGFCAGLTWVLYVLVYTPLKQRTVWNTAVGAIPGALPVLIGWTCVNDSLSLSAWLLFGILFLWQFPHFMAIAWIYRKQYRDAGYWMLSRDDANGRKSGALAVVTAIGVVVLAVWFSYRIDATLGIASAILSGVQLMKAVRFFKDTNDQTARRLLRFSLIYLPAQLGLITFFVSRLV